MSFIFIISSESIVVIQYPFNLLMLNLALIIEIEIIIIHPNLLVLYITHIYSGVIISAEHL